VRPLLRPGAVAIVAALAITAAAFADLVQAPAAGAAVARPGVTAGSATPHHPAYHPAYHPAHHPGRRHRRGG
jgi:hypothetical protein